MELKSNEEKITRALLVSVDTGEYDAQASLDELFELVKSAGADPVLSVTQNLQKIEKGTFVGTGKLAEIAEICESQEIDLLVFDSELSPTQIKNIEAETDVRVIDRTTLILDIFAQRARSKEGKLQVELAQLKYMLPRLTGKGIAMSRLGGGIGTRGPGETKLETDRRHIRRRIESLKEELSDLEKHRQMLRSRRKKDGVITCAIVGYTNAGKSTLMNIIGCLDVPTSGEHILSGRTIADMDEKTLAHIRGREIGFIFQQFNLLPKQDALENVELPMIYAGVHEKERRERATVLLEKVGLGDKLHHFPNQMSGGQQQRVAIARAMANSPSILLADEPTGNLDPKNSREIMKLLETINERGTTVLVVTHNQEIVDQMKKRVIVMNKGVIISDERNAGYTQNAN